MKRSVLLLLLALPLMGCEQYKKLIGDDDPSPAPTTPLPISADNPVTMPGLWRGFVDIGGTPRIVGFHVNNNTGQPRASFFNIYISTFRAAATVQVDGKNVTMNIDEGFECPNKWMFTGTLSGFELSGTLVGNGNPGLPSTTCFPIPINDAVTFTKSWPPS